MGNSSIRAAAVALALAFWSTLLAPEAGAADKPPVEKVAVVSVFGDVMHVVTYQTGTGSHMDRNEKKAFAVPDRTFDTYAANAGKALIAKRAPGVEAIAVDPDAATGMTAATPAKDDRITLPDALAKTLADSGATHVLLLTPARAEASLRVVSGHVGSGMLEGIGFYIDTRHRMKRMDTGESGEGFIAPYAYLDGTLIDVASGTVQRTARATEGWVIPAVRGTGTSTHPWATLDEKQKVAALQRQIRRSLELIVPALLTTP